MSTIINKVNNKVLDAVSVNANQSSSSVDIRDCFTICSQHVWSGVSGTVTVYVEGTCVLLNPQDTDYSPIDTYSIATATGNRMLNIPSPGYPSIRVRVSQTSGAGTLTSIINGKAFS